MSHIIAVDRTDVKLTIARAVGQWRRVVVWLQTVPSAIWLIVALLLATAARLPALGEQSLWIDEGNTYIRAVLPLGVVLENLLAVRNQTPFYYLLMRPWVALFGVSEFVLRLPSTWCAVVNVALIYRLGRLSGQRRVGVWAALAMALSPFLVRLAREARMYTMAVLFGTGAMWGFLLAVRRGGWQHWAVFVVFSGMSYLTHYSTLALALVQLFVFLSALRTTYPALRKWVLAQAVAVVPAGGWMACSMFSHGYGGILGLWIPMPSLLAPLRTLWNFSLGYDGRFTPWAAWGLVPFAAGLAGMARLRAERLWRTCVLTWLAVPPVIALVLSLGLRPCYVDRYLSFCAPAYLLGVVAGLTARSRAWLRGALGTLLMVAMGVSTLGILQGQRLLMPDWQGAIARVLEQAEDGDRLFVDAKGFYVTIYYTGSAMPVERIDVSSAGVVLEEALCREGRVWFLYRDPAESCHVFDRVRRFDPYSSGQPEIGAWLVDHASQVSREWILDGVYLALLEPGNCDSSMSRQGGGLP